MPEPIRVDVAIVPTAARAERELAQLEAAIHAEAAQGGFALPLVRPLTIGGVAH